MKATIVIIMMFCAAVLALVLVLAALDPLLDAPKLAGAAFATMACIGLLLLVLDSPAYAGYWAWQRLRSRKRQPGHRPVRICDGRRAEQALGRRT